MADKNIELMKKLKALAERGMYGERENARKMLDKLIKKYGIDERELDDDVLSEHQFRFKTKDERTILTQVMVHIIPKRHCYYYRKNDGKVYAECTESEAVLVSIEFDFYKKAWKEEVEFFMRAFIQKHSLFDISPDAGTDWMSDEDYIRMMKMMGGMKDRIIQPRLEAGGK